MDKIVTAFSCLFFISCMTIEKQQNILSSYSSGLIGCSPDIIQIEHEPNSFGNTTQWQATCKDKKFICSRPSAETKCTEQIK